MAPQSPALALLLKKKLPGTLWYTADVAAAGHAAYTPALRSKASQTDLAYM
jgi:hypothetical protein